MAQVLVGANKNEQFPLHLSNLNVLLPAMAGLRPRTINLHETSGPQSQQFYYITVTIKLHECGHRTVLLFLFVKQLSRIVYDSSEVDRKCEN